MSAYSFRPKDPNKFGTYSVYECDEVALAELKKVVAERGHAELYEETPEEKLFLDQGGMIHTDEVTMIVRAGGIAFEVFAIHVDLICDSLKRRPCCSDAAHIAALPSRWVSIFISAERAKLLLAALHEIQEEASRLADESYRKREQALKGLNKNGPVVISLPHSHRTPESRN